MKWYGCGGHFECRFSYINVDRKDITRANLCFPLIASPRKHV